MNWNKHYAQEGAHAFLSPSQATWINYTDEDLLERFTSQQAIKRGTELHKFAELAIKHGIKQPKSHKTIYEYINDGIGFRMQPEVVLYYSKWCFGTADTIAFRKEPKISKNKPVLRIHDLKTGQTPAKMRQLYVYTALFCLEYDYLPSEIVVINRIYQSDEIYEETPTSEIIVPIMDKIVRFDRLIDSFEKGD